MTITSRAAVFSVALAALMLVPTAALAQQPPQQSQQPTQPPAQQQTLGDRLATAIQGIQQPCAADVSKFCGSVSPGEGRVLLCMQAHDDQLSRACQFSLYRASRNLDRVINRVERMADACWNDIEAQCANADRIGQCVMEKAQSQQFSQACQTVVTGLRQIGQALETRGSGSR
jgi:hypothetical protein